MLQKCGTDAKSLKFDKENSIEPFVPPYYAVTRNSFIYALDSICSRVEWGLGFAAIVPFVGTIPALIRIALGAAQFTLALASSAATLFLCFSKVGRDIFLHSLRHIVHGLVNILAGVLEAIPVIGTLLGSSRELKSITTKGGVCNVNQERCHFLGYSTVRYHGWKEAHGLGDEIYEISDTYLLDFTSNVASWR